ncbi:MAG: CBS domain-containing protein [Burkholderiales bacterium]|nr:CBS domain-containing protein [Burkholderiales bacterium]MDE2296858.1 CBS domain-containing protein [Burkholderiales bacterium]
MLVKDICTLDAVSCGRDTNILEAARLMRLHHTGDLIIVDDPQGDRTPVGIVTDRDIVVEVLAAERDPATTRVSGIMPARLVIASAAEDVAEAVERMRLHGVRRLPVVDHDGSLLGIVTLDDILTLHAEQAATLAAIVAKEQTREQRSRR